MIDSPRSSVRFRLKSLMLVVAVFGLVAAWISDHRRLEDRNRQLLSANVAQNDQIDALKQRLKTRSSAVQIIYWWASADEFVEMLKTADEQAFLEKAPSIAGADQAVIDDTVQELIQILENQNETTTERALTSLRYAQESAPEKLTGHASSIVSSVVLLLASDSDAIVAESIATLQSFGPAAREALPQLTERMEDNNDWFAPNAAIAIASIEPATQIGTRMIELVKMKHPNWYHAAFDLHRFVDTGSARRVLLEAHASANSDAERNMATIALNQIQPEAEP